MLVLKSYPAISLNHLLLANNQTNKFDKLQSSKPTNKHIPNKQKAYKQTKNPYKNIYTLGHTQGGILSPVRSLYFDKCLFGWRYQEKQRFQHSFTMSKVAFIQFAVCFLMCLFKSLDCLQEQLHCLQAKGFSPVCENM